jgi:hypothetical protein
MEAAVRGGVSIRSRLLHIDEKVESVLVTIFKCTSSTTVSRASKFLRVCMGLLIVL